MNARAFVMYGKPGCHLCDDLRQLVDELIAQDGGSLRVVDITGDTDLIDLYRYVIPVLMLNGREVARGRVEERALLRAIADAGGQPAG